MSVVLYRRSVTTAAMLGVAAYIGLSSVPGSAQGERSKRLKSREFRKFVGLNRRYSGSRKVLTEYAPSAVQILTPTV
jgi:hypothetical protein